MKWGKLYRNLPNCRYTSWISFFYFLPCFGGQIDRHKVRVLKPSPTLPRLLLPRVERGQKNIDDLVNLIWICHRRNWAVNVYFLASWCRKLYFSNAVVVFVLLQPTSPPPLFRMISRICYINSKSRKWWKTRRKTTNNSLLCVGANGIHGAKSVTFHSALAHRNHDWILRPTLFITRPSMAGRHSPPITSSLPSLLYHGILHCWLLT